MVLLKSIQVCNMRTLDTYTHVHAHRSKQIIAIDKCNLNLTLLTDTLTFVIGEAFDGAVPPYPRLSEIIVDVDGLLR